MKLKNQRYEEIKITIANFLEDYNVNSIPVDVFCLAEKMKIKIVFSSEIYKKSSTKINKTMFSKYPHSYLYFDPNYQKFIIYIDDLRTTKQRQRFSLAHEIIHIILGHTEQNEKNEAEANFGATYLLAPTSLALTRIDKDMLLMPDKVKNIFDVSASEAKIIVRYNFNRLSLPNLNEKDYEKTINELLNESLNNIASRFY